MQRLKAHKQKLGAYKSILPSITQFQLSIPNLKNILKDQWHLIRNQPLLKIHPVIITVIINLYFKLTRKCPWFEGGSFVSSFIFLNFRRLFITLRAYTRQLDTTLLHDIIYRSLWELQILYPSQKEGLYSIKEFLAITGCCHDQALPFLGMSITYHLSLLLDSTTS